MIIVEYSIATSLIFGGLGVRSFGPCRRLAGVLSHDDPHVPQRRRLCNRCGRVSHFLAPAAH